MDGQVCLGWSETELPSVNHTHAVELVEIVIHMEFAKAWLICEGTISVSGFKSIFNFIMRMEPTYSVEC